MTNRGASSNSREARRAQRDVALVLPVSFMVTLLTTGSVQAQHAQTVLMGDPNEAGLALPAERTAVHPISAPYYNEDAFVTTDLRFWYVNHQFPGNSLLAGADASVYALQIRAALTESLQLVAYKDGYVDISDPVDESGMNDLAAGLKWAFLQNWERDMHAALGAGYEFATGDEEVLQDDEEARLWASFNKGFNRWHFGANANFTWAVGDEDVLGDSDRLSWHLHADYFLTQSFSPVVEVNGYSTLSEGGNTPLPFNGVDVANLGGGDGEDVVTGVIGAEFRPADGFGLRLGYESPLTDNEDLFGYRWTFSAIWGF
jgi:hypothetical protein